MKLFVEVSEATWPINSHTNVILVGCKLHRKRTINRSTYIGYRGKGQVRKDVAEGGDN